MLSLSESTTVKAKQIPRFFEDEDNEHDSSIPLIRRATLYGQLPFELDRRMADSKAFAQLLIHSLQKIVIASGLRFNQMHGQSGLGGAQRPDMQMMEISNAR